ncbi:MAG: hypothetical protein ACMUEM_03965 [Flavobacteriales bacterium AspAUS03]
MIPDRGGTTNKVKDPKLPVIVYVEGVVPITMGRTQDDVLQDWNNPSVRM